MSGLLRRIKRSRPADAGEPHPEGRAAEAEGAATTPATAPAPHEETRTDASEATTQIVPPAAAGESGASEGGAAAEDAAGVAPQPRRARRWRLRRRAREIPPAALTPVPVLKADPNVPAGIDPAAAPLRPPAGRRGRLRRRLRYLRRARELMLRDLGGLLYEIHRTGGGNVEAHANVVGAKVQRIAGLDAEAHALETALAAPRAESVVFEPGVGGTCATCGELYGSDARFCANCGTPIGVVPETRPPETHEVVSAPARRAFWRRAARPAKPAGDEAPKDAPDETPAGEAIGGEAKAAGRDETAVAASDETAAEEATRGDKATDEATRSEPPADAPTRSDEPAGDATSSDEPASEATDSGGDEPPRDPRSGGRNGRPDDRQAPGLSSGDPLFSRERS